MCVNTPLRFICSQYWLIGTKRIIIDDTLYPDVVDALLFSYSAYNDSTTRGLRSGNKRHVYTKVFTIGSEQQARVDSA